jgi:hypothetical protein
MRSRLLFQSTSLLRDADPSDSEPEGKVLAYLLAEGLSRHGFPVKKVVMEDWGWVVVIDNRAVPLRIGCGFSGISDDGLHCFIQPNKSHIWRCFRSVDLRPTVDRLAQSIELLIQQSGDARELSWEDQGATARH